MAPAPTTQNRSGLPGHSQPGRRRAAARVLVWLLVGLFVQGSFSSGRLDLQGASPAPEYHLKAAFLYNFAKFVEWPTVTPGEGEMPFRFGILGSNPFGSDLEEVLKGHQLRGRPLEIRVCRNAEEARACQLVFIGTKEDSSASALRALHGLPVLTVGESDRFKSEGGIITLVMEGDKVRFEINLEAARAAGLKIDAQLLRLARKVTPVTP
jgi:hypothetical protein